MLTQERLSEIRARLMHCPFCGTEPGPNGVRLIEQGHDRSNGWRYVDYRVCCLECGVTTISDEEEKVVDLWNRRAEKT